MANGDNQSSRGTGPDPAAGAGGDAAGGPDADPASAPGPAAGAGAAAGADQAAGPGADPASAPGPAAGAKPAPEPGAGTLPAIPASAGALIFDRKGRLLILKPTYKSGWTIPGGVMEADGETPWEACQREVREECGLDARTGRLVCVDFRRPRPGRPGGMRFLFDCGVFADASLGAIVLQPEEICEHRLATLATALKLLRGPIRRRVKAASRAAGLVYLEDGRTPKP